MQLELKKKIYTVRGRYIISHIKQDITQHFLQKADIIWGHNDDGSNFPDDALC